ncbi:MAG: sulfatase [Chitinophagaceae bacterium]|jgi:arylsulfatase A-like enzyme
MTKLLKIFLTCFFLFVFHVINGQSKPNIILFLVDDMGWQDCSVSFWNQQTALNRLYETPNLERLAKQGIKFTNAYANPVCTPTRISIMTGLNVVRHGVTNWTSVHKDTPTDHPDEHLIPAKWNFNGLNPLVSSSNAVHATALPLLLQNAGYHTLHVGKAHFAPYGTPGSNPLSLGFNVNIAGTAAGHPGSFLAEDLYGAKSGDTLWAVRNLSSHIEHKDFLTDALTEEAIRAIDQNILSGKPFFLYMSHYAVHIPLSKDPRYYQKYIDKGMSDAEARYAGLIEGMDKSLGDIMQYLKKIQADKNTYIIFMSDNGGLSLAPPRNGTNHIQNLPLKKGKGSLYEGGIRVPFVVAGPGIQAGQISHQLIVAEDLFPTILQWAGINHPDAIQKIDGKKFNASLKNPAKRDDQKILLWHYPNNWTNINEHGISWCSAMRQGKWKLIYFHKDQQLELYNLDEDIQEQHNLSQSMPSRLKEMAALMTAEMKNRNAEMPVVKKTGRAVLWPDQAIQFLKK